MVRKQRKRISYVLPLANSAGGHRLGVNGLAVDPHNSILYSGGRDGVICAWDLNLDLSPFGDRALYTSLNASGDPSSKNALSVVFRQQVQAHTHWINDIVLAQNNEALVSASSDITVKLWRPGAQDPLPPQTIGLHSDYVKTLASPGSHANWVASGGLDRKIYLWDLNGAGQKLQIDVGEDETTAKGSVYALAVTSTLLASGGPESIVRVWDPRSGKRVTKFVGHTDNIRDVLISQDGDTVMTASSDQTVKVWSMTAGRCMYTLTMHNDSVWSLCSDHPRLSVFYSSDRSGLVAKTDTRGCSEMDEGIAVAVCQEHEGVNKVIGAGDYIWTGTSSSSINRWLDVDTEADVQVPESYSYHRASVATMRSRLPSPPVIQSSPTNNSSSKQIPYKSVLRLSNAAPFYVRSGDDRSTMYSAASIRKASEGFVDGDGGGMTPYRSLPDYTIEGQHGLIKHVTLNDRRRVLTLDTASEVVMWDLLQCVPVKSFGKRHLDEVLDEVNTMETVAHWCAVDTRTGSLTCVLEENTCFDAEMYADDLDIEENIDFREDQRINLGKWILRYLFSNLIDEEIKRDELYRHALQDPQNQTIERAGAPTSIQMPPSDMSSWLDTSSAPTSASTLKAPNGFHFPAHTPGLAIALATPAAPPIPASTAAQAGGLSPAAEEGSSSKGHARTPSDRHSSDYFSVNPNTTAGVSAIPGANEQLAAAADATSDQGPTTPDAQVTDTPSIEKTGMFGKKMWKNFGMKSLKKTQTKESNPAPVEERFEDSDSRSSKTEDRIIEENFLGSIQKLRLEYDADMQIFERNEKRGLIEEGESPKLESKIQPSLPNDTPVLKPPANTTILIQEDRVDSGGVADLFEGTVGNLGQQADRIERVAPVWLADVLLMNHIPVKEIVKVSFILEPWQNVLPSIATDGNTRLNANRMLRARKILSYVAERIEPQFATHDPTSLRPEDYLELYCQNQLIPPTMTLATIRAHIWRGGGDVLLFYKANDRREVRHVNLPLISSAAAGAEKPGGVSMATALSSGPGSADGKRSVDMGKRSVEGSQRNGGPSHELNRFSEDTARRPMTPGGAPAMTLKGQPALREF